MSASGSAFDFSVFKRLMWYMKPYKTTLAFSFSLTILMALLSPIRPLLVQYTFDHHIQKRDMHGLITMTVLMIIVLLIEALVQFYDTYTANRLGQNVIKDIRVQLYKKIVGFRLKYFDK